MKKKEIISGESPTNGAKESIEFGIPYTVNIELQGSSDILFHRWNNEAVAEKSKTELDALNKLDNFRKFVDFMRKKTIEPIKYLTTIQFSSAFFAFLNVTTVEFDLFMKRLPYKMDILHVCGQQKQYLEILRDIYNYRNKNPLTKEDIDVA